MATVIRGGRVFDGAGFGQPYDVVIDGDAIVDAAAQEDNELVDAAGGYLIPGLIDCHLHLSGPETLTALAAHGVTTALDMGSPAQLVTALRDLPGSPHVCSSLMAATSPQSAHAQRMQHALKAPEALVDSNTDVDAWVSTHVGDGADYIKIIIDLPGFEQQTVDALVSAAHAQGRKTVAHAARLDAVTMAQRAGVDVLTHVPLDRPIGAAQAAELAASGTIVIPTLTMMRATADNLHAAGISGPSYEAARASVMALHAAGVTVLAGTDANVAPAAPASPPFGSSLHDELELLVDAGLTPYQAIKAATSFAAQHFGLPGRDSIAPGRRADLVLLDRDPFDDVSGTRAVRIVWCGGVRVR